MIFSTKYGMTEAESLVLNDVNCTLVVKRNLSASWFTEIPSLDIDGSFDPIHVSGDKVFYAG